jgi:N-sulfoglucosamine sulfohydrolase
MKGMTNILYIHSHDTGRFVQPYGYAVATPNIQRLAEEGVLFRQAFNVSPTCTPSRASMLTGQYAHTCGMFGLAHRGFVLAHPQYHLAAYLGTQGYYTVLDGMQHEHRDPYSLGYEAVLDTPTRQARDVTPLAVQFLSSAPQEPFFLSVGFEETHRPYHQAGPAEDPRYCLPPPLFPDTPETRQDMANFKASARLFDAGVGAVLDALEQNGLAQDTLVICTTDHGLAFPRMKCNLNQHGMGVFLILRGPGGLTGGKVIDALVSHIDLYPTLCEVAGLPAPAWLQGVSLLPLVRGETQAVRETAFGEVNYHCVYEPMRSARTLRWNYIRRFHEYQHALLPNCDASPTKEFWKQNGWFDQKPVPEELYDLTLDPNELNNLAQSGSPQHSHALGEMRARLERWMHETEDPLLQGPIPAPHGTELNPWDADSADDLNYFVE